MVEQLIRTGRYARGHASAPGRRPPADGRQGFALVIVLITIIFAATIAVMFLAAAGSERRGVDTYARGNHVRQIADMAVNRVMGLIGAATKEGTAAVPVSWASQPGMIRTFDSSGALQNAYKLYSWDNPVVPGSGFDPSSAKEVPPGSWQTDSAIYTDLNAPRTTSGNLTVYPIVDPRAKGLVEGFSISGAPGATPDQEAPMPVKWLYVLEDGQLVAPTGSGTTANVAGATAANPIVGRIAFWADDETCKVNINTASEGAYWDWPKAASRDEMQFAGNPPVKNEFNRTPGHPAMTSLSAVFPAWLSADRWLNQGGYRAQMDKIFQLTPRTAWGGSLGGTFPITDYNQAYSPAAGVTTPAPISQKSERLFVSPDELLFLPTRSQTTQLTADDLQQRNFFLTASSRAPETTLFETPRISLWPITWPHDSAYFRARGGSSGPNLDPDTADIDSNPWMTAADRLLAFCGTLNKGAAGGEDRYFVQRKNPDSPTDDWNTIDRNRELFGDYLRRLTGQRTPGFGGALSSNPARDAIATKIFDFIRSNVNQSSTGATPAYSYTGVSLNAGTAIVPEPQAYSVVPIRTDFGTLGLGCFPRLREAALVFFATARTEPVFTGTPGHENDPRLWTNLIDVAAGNAQTTQMKAVLLFDFISGLGPSIGQTPTFWIKIRQGSFSIAGQATDFSGRSVQWSSFLGSKIIRMPSFAGLFKSKTSGADRGKDPEAKTFDPTSNSADNWSLVSAAIPVSGTTFSFSSTSPLVVEIYGVNSSNPKADPTGDPNLLVTSYTVDFSAWNSSLPTPLAPRWCAWDYPAAATAVPSIPDPAFKAAPTDPLNFKGVGAEIAPLLLEDVTSTSRPKNLNTGTGCLSSYIYNYSNNFETRVKGCDSWSAATITPAYAPASGGKSGNPFVQGNTTSYQYGIPLITPFDTVISMVANPTAANGDPRVVENPSFIKVADAFPSGTQPRDVIPRTVTADPAGSPSAPRQNRQYHTLGSTVASGLSTGFGTDRSILNVAMADASVGISGTGSRVGVQGNRKDWMSKIKPFTFATGLATGASVGDWTSSPGGQRDGGVLVRPDQDYMAFYVDPNESSISQTPYFTTEDINDALYASYFSPNRQVPSPVILGSLPRSTSSGWETLAFNPSPAVSTHPGLASAANKAPDHLWLDFFWMPVAEPYPISDQLSTAGKVNLNYQIAPFSYIKRATALWAAMKSTWITAIPTATASDYKSPYYMRTTFGTTKTRYPVAMDETLKGFDAKFAGGDIFRSASQLCEMPLVPQGSTASTLASFWSDKLLTSDTAREEPYDHLYSRVTTKSNTFTVHWCAQVLRKRPNSDPAVWEEGKDSVVSELRGATLIERFIKPDSTNIPDYATDSAAKPLSQFYSWRVVSENLFRP